MIKKQISPSPKNRLIFISEFEDGDSQNIKNFQNFHLKSYTKKSAILLFQSKTFSNLFFKYLDFNIS